MTFDHECPLSEWSAAHVYPSQIAMDFNFFPSPGTAPDLMDFHFFPSPGTAPGLMDFKRGTTTLGFKFQGGIIIAVDSRSFVRAQCMWDHGEDGIHELRTCS